MSRDRFRVGGSWKVTVVQYDADEPAGPDGKRPSDRLLCMAASPRDAQRIASAMVRAASAVEQANQ